MSIILSALSYSIKSNVGQFSSTKHIWEIIQNIHAGEDHVGKEKDDDDHASSQVDSHMEDCDNEEKEEEEEEEEVDMEKVLINALKELKNIKE